MAAKFDPPEQLPGGHSPASWSNALLRAVDLGLAGVVLFAPWFMGGRHPLGALVYVLLVSFTAIAWTVRRSLSATETYYRSGTELWFVLCLGLILCQILPWPASWIQMMSPGLSSLLPMWAGETDATAALGAWSTISLYPEATRGSLILFVAHAMLFVVVVQRVRSLSDIESLLRLLAVAAVAMAIIGLAQFAFGNGKFLWIYEHPFRDTSRVAKGPYINENHFSHFLALGLGPLVWWLTKFQKASRERRGGRTHRPASSAPSSSGPSMGDAWRRFGRPLLTIATGIVIFAVLVSFSRGGMISLLVALSVCGGLLAWKTKLARATIVRFAVVGGLVLVAVLAYGYRPLIEHISSLGVGSWEELDQQGSRWELWQANLQAFRDFPILGTGGGSHVEVYKVYYEKYVPFEYTHAESGYVQVLSEYGLTGAALLVVAIATCVYWCVHALWISESTRLSACLAAVTAGLAVSVVHSIWDFVWYLPSCMSMAVMLAACASRLSELAAADSPSGDSNPRRWFAPRQPLVAARPLWLTATIVLIATSAMLLFHQAQPALAAAHWEQFIVASKAIEKDSAGPHPKIANQALVEYLTKTIQAYPNDARANMTLAANYLRQFEIAQQHSVNPMPLSAIRDAVLSSQFATVEARDNWLTIVLGKNQRLLTLARYYAERALRLCPLQGQGYVFLNELAFLAEAGDRQQAALLQQAVRVRPTSGAVLVAVGAEAAQAGDIQRALVSWKSAFQHDPQQQQQLIELLAARVPVAFFFAHFDPDVSALERLFKHYREIGREDQAREVGQPLAQLLVAKAKAESGRRASRSWRLAHEVFKQGGANSQCLECLRQAVRVDPSDFVARRTLALELLAQSQYDEAIQQIRWCLYRKPDDAALNSALKNSHTKRLEASSISRREDDRAGTRR